MLSNASDLSGQLFKLEGGMQLGIAGQRGLANPAQAGVLAFGQIFQGFGNWQYTTQSLDLLCIPFTAPQNDAGIVFTWTPGQTLQDALTTALTNAYPNQQLVFSINPALQPMGTVQHFAQDFASFAAWVQVDLTAPQGAPLGLDNYQGVGMAFVGNTIRIADSSLLVKPPRQLQFQDLIGQPTWINSAEINFKTVLRADLSIHDWVSMPTNLIPPYVLTTPEAASSGAPSRVKTGFRNQFMINEVHHFGSSRQPDADAWCTVYKAVQPATVVGQP
jgi:hypothetical protein